MSAEFDVVGLDQLTAAFVSAPDKVMKAAAAVTVKAAVNIKAGMRADTSGIRHAPGFPGAIGYDMTRKGGELEAVIGPKAGGAGSLALLYFGNSKTGPVADVMRPINAEVPVYLAFLSKITADALD